MPIPWTTILTMPIPRSALSLQDPDSLGLFFHDAHCPKLLLTRCQFREGLPRCQFHGSFPSRCQFRESIFIAMPIPRKNGHDANFVSDSIISGPGYLAMPIP